MSNIKNLAGLLLLLAILSVSGFGATYTVINTSDDGSANNCNSGCSLRQAINRANQTGAADTIIFSSLFNTAQTITLTNGQLQITSAINITGPGARLLAVDGNAASRVLNITAAGALTLSGITIRNGNAGNGNLGGGIQNLGSLNLANVSVTGNVAGSGGGGIETEGPTTIDNSVISGNSVTSPLGGGAGMTLSTSVITIRSSTISGNTTAAGSNAVGGGIAVTAGNVAGNATVSLINVTITNNTAGQGGGAFLVSTSNFTIRNTLIANNTSASGNADVNGFSTNAITSSGNNLVRDPNPSHFTAGSGDIVGVDPLIGVLADNGGPTNTHALLTGSPAIDAGNDCVTTGSCGVIFVSDQRGAGFPRLSGAHVDIGAFELALAAVNNPPAGTDKTISTVQNTPYTFTAADFGFTDPSDTPPNSLLAVKITTLPALGTLTNNNVAVTAGDFIPVADINAGLLKFTPANGGVGSPYTNFTFQVQDDGGTVGGGVDLDQSPNTITINVTAAISFIVTKTADTNDGVCDADCSLREAVAAANANPDFNVITFSPTVFSTPQSIQLLFGFGSLILTNPVSITGPDAGVAITAQANVKNLVVNTGVTASISKLAIANGFSESSGGCVLNNGTLTLDRVLVANCTSDQGAAGAIFNDTTGTLTIVNSTLSNNTASTAGGAIGNAGTLTLVNDTITRNTANGTSGVYGGGVISFGGSTTRVLNTIIAENTSLGAEADVAGTFVSLGHNVIGISDGSNGFTNGVNGDQVGTVAARLIPGLGPLALNGGPTATHALLAGSPAINAGDNCVLTSSCSGVSVLVNVDQRGITRPQPQVGTVDIGAFEYLAPTAAGVTVSGRVIDAYGRAISGALVSITGFDGVAVVVRTNTFGYFKFEDVTAGQSVVLLVSAKRYTFDPLFLNIQDNVTDLQLRPR